MSMYATLRPPLLLTQSFNNPKDFHQSWTSPVFCLGRQYVFSFKHVSNSKLIFLLKYSHCAASMILYFLKKCMFISGLMQHIMKYYHSEVPVFIGSHIGFIVTIKMITT